MISRSFLATLLAVAVGCGGGGGTASSRPDTAATDPSPEPSGTAGGEASEQGAADPAPAGENFAIQAVPQPPFSVGGQARADVSLEARNGYHVNQEYPIELRVQAPAGVDLAKARMARADASTFDEARAVFPVVFTPREAGRKEFTGELRFSVCNAQNCLLERRPVTFAVEVP